MLSISIVQREDGLWYPRPLSQTPELFCTYKGGEEEGGGGEGEGEEGGRRGRKRKEGGEGGGGEREEEREREEEVQNYWCPASWLPQQYTMRSIASSVLRLGSTSDP